MIITERNLNLELAQKSLVSLWLEQVNQQSLAPIINQEKAVDLLSQAKSTKQEVAFVAIGCADWVDWSNAEEKIWHVGRIDKTNKRLSRFTNEVLSFQQALLSFGINSVINISLSNVEMHDERPQGLDGRFDDQPLAQNNIDASNQALIDKFSEAKINFQFFDHWHLVNQLGFVTPRKFDTYLDFIKVLYAFDLSFTGPALVKSNQIGPVWLNIQAFSFPELVATLRKEAETCAPDLPILSPFKNASNWHAKPETENRFLNAIELMASQFQFKLTSSETNWREKNLKLPDPVILAALNVLEIQDFIINDDWEKRKLAIEILAQIAFNKL